MEEIGRVGGAGGKDTSTRIRKGKGKKGFRYRIKSGSGPGNTTVRELLSDDLYAEAVLDFLRAAKVELVKNGVFT